ncbi:MAG: hypothetical protein QW416_08305 [Candidatus Nitrosocaldaceae archaeon]
MVQINHSNVTIELMKGYIVIICTGFVTDSLRVYRISTVDDANVVQKMTSNLFT